MIDLAPARLVAPWWRSLWARLTGRDVELVQQLKLEALTRINVELELELALTKALYVEVSVENREMRRALGTSATDAGARARSECTEMTYTDRKLAGRCVEKGCPREALDDNERCVACRDKHRARCRRWKRKQRASVVTA